jgi:hypothetical protein
MAYTGIKPKNPLPEWVFKVWRKDVTRIGHFSNRLLGDLKLVAELSA